MEAKQIFKDELERIKPTIGRRHEYFIHQKDELELNLTSYNSEEEKYEFLMNELVIAKEMVKHLQAQLQENISFIDELNSFSSGILAANEVVNFIREKIIYDCATVLFNEDLAGIEKAKLNLTEQILLISYLQESGNFIKRESNQTQKPIHDLVGLLLGVSYDRVRKTFPITDQIKAGRLSPNQVKDRMENLKKIKDIFKIIGESDTCNKIEERIRQLELLHN